jgi:hypothetical protein
VAERRTYHRRPISTHQSPTSTVLSWPRLWKLSTWRPEERTTLRRRRPASVHGPSRRSSGINERELRQ